MGKRLLSIILILAVLGSVGVYQYWSWITRKPFTVRYAYAPFAEDAPIFIAVEKGFFKEENLNVSLTKFLAGAKMLEAAAAGSLDGGYFLITQALQAFEGGVDLKLARGGSYQDLDHDASAMVTAVNSSIQSMEDLRGKVFAVSGFAAHPMMVLQVAIEKHGLNVSDIQFTVIESSATRVQALVSGRIDVTHLGEPYLTQVLNAGNIRIIYRYVTEVFPNHRFQMSRSFFLKRFIDRDKEAVDAFTRAFNKAVDWINANPAETREIIAKWTEIDVEIAKKMVVPAFTKDIMQDDIREIIDLMRHYGYLTKDIALQDFLYQG